ncbi:MAG: NUDIX hydrolase [Actinomycetota bacterium]|nr:NUDIX hydrolase [Actinomycetota bacterium]
MPLPATFHRLASELKYRGSLISVTRDTFAGPDGQPFERDVVHHPGAVSVVPVLESGEVMLVRQYRAAVDAELLELVAGKRDVADEPPEETARRELAEEIGMQPGKLLLLARFFNSPGFCDEFSYTFLARDLKPVPSSAQGIEEQHMTIHRIALDDVPALILSGDIVDAKTIIGLTLARQLLE